jgi:hypothetical protein
MRTSSRPNHRKIRKSTLEIRQEKWKRAARRVVATSMSQLFRDGDVVIPRREENIGRIFTASAQERLAKASAEAKAFEIQVWDEPAQSNPTRTFAAGRYTSGNWESFFPHLFLIGLFILGCVGAILAIGKAIDAFVGR